MTDARAAFLEGVTKPTARAAIEFLLANGPSTSAQLAGGLGGISRSRVGQIVAGLVREGRVVRRTMGRYPRDGVDSLIMLVPPKLIPLQIAALEMAEYVSTQSWARDRRRP